MRRRRLSSGGEDHSTARGARLSRPVSRCSGFSRSPNIARRPRLPSSAGALLPWQSALDCRAFARAAACAAPRFIERVRPFTVE